MDYTVFVKERLNRTGDIVIYGTYHPYWTDKDRGITNKKFDIYSDRLLNLKNGKIESILYFQYLLEIEINSGIMVCVVPSSDPQNPNTGIAKWDWHWPVPEERTAYSIYKGIQKLPSSVREETGA